MTRLTVFSPYHKKLKVTSTRMPPPKMNRHLLRGMRDEETPENLRSGEAPKAKGPRGEVYADAAGRLNARSPRR
ncbi:MAG: hypothetical protein JO252_27045 [Planctomycetaceae bacterium]|nr:hypothetical protein [Planctomycetaceae bacterium]MBV8608574.1 hypothetical protein [Singulisphaera sp.]